MKKIIILFLILSFSFFVSGCSFGGQKETSEQKDSDEMTNENEIVRTLAEHEDLAAEYNEAVIKTNLGDIRLEFFSDESPITVNNFLNLAKRGFYDGTKFHRVIKDFMIQGGCPNSKDDDWSDDGRGNAGYRFEDEFNDRKIIRGSLAMANSGSDTNSSQFFIVTALATPSLDGVHTNFGKVIDEASMATVIKIESLKTSDLDHPLEDAVIESIELVKQD